jgi:uncharacterized membrane protein
VHPADIIESLGHHARVASAVAPFVVAMALRLMLGKSRFTAWCVTLGTMWFAINVLLAPYSPQAQHEIESLWALFR